MVGWSEAWQERRAWRAEGGESPSWVGLIHRMREQEN